MGYATHSHTPDNSNLNERENYDKPFHSTGHFWRNAAVSLWRFSPMDWRWGSLKAIWGFKISSHYGIQVSHTALSTFSFIFMARTCRIEAFWRFSLAEVPMEIFPPFSTTIFHHDFPPCPSILHHFPPLPTTSHHFPPFSTIFHHFPAFFVQQFLELVGTTILKVSRQRAQKWSAQRRASGPGDPAVGQPFSHSVWLIRWLECRLRWCVFWMLSWWGFP